MYLDLAFLRVIACSSDICLCVWSPPRSVRQAARTRLAACSTTVLVAATKIFLGASCWQLAAIATGAPKTSIAYAVAAGAGDCGGTFAGNALLIAALGYWRGWLGCAHLCRSGLVVGAGALLSGILWQPLVHWLHGRGLGFDAGSALTGAACGGAFFLGVSLAAAAVAYHSSGSCSRPRSDVLKDLSLAVAVGGGCERAVAGIKPSRPSPLSLPAPRPSPRLSARAPCRVLAGRRGLRRH